MRTFDHQGLLAAEYQGKLFEKSEELNCSSPIFIRRFLHSDLLKRLDADSYMSYDVTEGIENIIQQFGNSDYGKEKYSRASLFWMGYMYRYIAYTREQTTSYTMKLFPYDKLNDLYYTYHTQDPEWCIENLLALNNLSESIFDNNSRLKEIIRKEGIY